MTMTADETAAAEDESRSERLNLRATPSEAALIRQAASARRISVTEFMLNAALSEARTALTEDRRLTLRDEVFDRLLERFDSPDEAVDALTELIKEPRRVKLPRAK